VLLLLLLLLLQVDTLDDAIAVVNGNPYGNGTAIFTDSGSAARKFQHDVQVRALCDQGGLSWVVAGKTNTTFERYALLLVSAAWQCAANGIWWVSICTVLVWTEFSAVLSCSVPYRH
jgi:hypothetical protein